MSKYRKSLPQLEDRLFLTDGGLETTLVFHEGLELPEFAAFSLLRSPDGIERLNRYFRSYIGIARAAGRGIVLDSATYRASPDWGQRIGYDEAGLANANRLAIGHLLELRTEWETRQTPLVVSGAIGPRGDGYKLDLRMSAEEARRYHSWQVNVFAETDADMVTAFTMNYVDEAVGIVRAAQECQMPVVVSFTLETDGLLPSGETLAEAIESTDRASSGYAAYFMINCAHPTHFSHVLSAGGEWRSRIRGIRANASSRSHAELNDSTELDIGDPRELAGQYNELRALLPNLAVVGGCCGTDHRHVGAIAEASASW